MKRALTAVTLGTAFLTALATGVAGAEVRPADAWLRTNVSGTHACPRGYICIFEHYQGNRDHTGKMLAFKGDIENLSWYSANDWASSVVNKSRNTATLYGDYDFRGPTGVIRPGHRASFENNQPIHNDWTSSVRVRYGDNGGDDWNSSGV